jgi:hypothetical protein
MKVLELLSAVAPGPRFDGIPTDPPFSGEAVWDVADRAWRKRC